MDKQHWIFLSPHYDDVALSCGGLVWDLAHKGHQVEIWTLMGGFPPDENYSDFAQQNHLAWGMSGEAAIRMRRAEDHTACQILGAQHRHFDWPDAIYRRETSTGKPLIKNNQELFGKAPEETLVKAIQAMLENNIGRDTMIVFPLGLGNHIDHIAVSRAEEAHEGAKFYYADYPYILKAFSLPAQWEKTIKKKPHHLNEKALSHWQDAVLCYKSQINAFWRDEEETRLALRNYQAGGGGRLWVA
ncbi:MAG: PIG-L deacetylase family protein [Brevefilum sp.]